MYQQSRSRHSSVTARRKFIIRGMLRIFRSLRTVLALLGGVWLVVTFTGLVPWWAGRLAQPWGSGDGDVLIVLGGDNLNDNVLGLSSYWRSVYTVRAMRAHHFQRVIITGGNPSRARPALAELMRDVVRAHGIDTAIVEVETEATSTMENAKFTADLLRGRAGGRLVLLTSDFHVFRAYRVFRKVGLEVEPWPVPDVLKRSGARFERAGLFVVLAVETAKIGWYEWKGWI